MIERKDHEFQFGSLQKRAHGLFQDIQIDTETSRSIDDKGRIDDYILD